MSKDQGITNARGARIPKIDFVPCHGTLLIYMEWTLCYVKHEINRSEIWAMPSSRLQYSDSMKDLFVKCDVERCHRDGL